MYMKKLYLVNVADLPAAVWTQLLHYFWEGMVISYIPKKNPIMDMPLLERNYHLLLGWIAIENKKKEYTSLAI